MGGYFSRRTPAWGPRCRCRLSPGAGGGSAQELVKRKRKRGWWVGDVYWPPRGKQKVWRYNRGSCSSKQFHMWNVSTLLPYHSISCESVVIIALVTFVCFCYGRSDVAAPPRPPLKKIKLENHLDWISTAVRLEKHGTMPRSSILFLFFGPFVHSATDGGCILALQERR